MQGALGADRFRQLAAQKQAIPPTKRSRRGTLASEDTPPKRPQMSRENASSIKDSHTSVPGLAERGRLLCKGRDAAESAAMTENSEPPGLIPLADNCQEDLSRPPPVTDNVRGDGFQRAHLEKWMQRAADAAPRSRCTGQAVIPKAKVGGVQELYHRAVRDHLSRSHLETYNRASTQALPSAKDGAKVDDTGNQKEALLAVLDVSERPEGFLVLADVLQGADNVAEGCLARVIFHHRHPVFQQHVGWTPRRGVRLRINSFVIAAQCPTGPIILPQVVVPAM